VSGGRRKILDGGSEHIAEGHWYQDAVIYELHVRSYQDSDNNGIGDFPGLIQRLDYLQQLGVTALWLLPFYPSPLRDDGYDISDYRRVNPSFGTLHDVSILLEEAHARGLKVITELVLAHTSDQHPWFQRAIRSEPGSPARDFYLWSDTPDRFSEARIIFPDFETSNWAYSPEAGQYYWHRFYSHQPSLNWDNPVVRDEMFSVVDFWLEQGVDGLRLDAVPYLFAREGTTCMNLPETFALLEELRSHIDERFSDRMLLAEANLWPEDAVEYMGKGDRCQMAFHFPLMPRMFMAAQQEDRFPIVDILAETPDPPPGCQWALFLRNHDELTLEMVTDEERDYMYRAYAQDPRARVNMGIRRRLAPLLGNDRRLIEMMNALLFSLPGTPVIYYGDEIGMGDNLYLGDRDAVRTPMQWDADRNAGFSRAAPHQLFLPIVNSPAFGEQVVNVEAQDDDPNSLLWWMRRLIQLRRRYPAFSRGSLTMLKAGSRKILAFVRELESERLLVVVNLSRFAQSAELDLSAFEGATLCEMFGNTPFPVIGKDPYPLTMGPHGFFWFSVENEPAIEAGSRPTIEVDGSWLDVLADGPNGPLDKALTSFYKGHDWLRDEGRVVASASLKGTMALHDDAASLTPETAVFAEIEVTFEFGEPERHLLALGFASKARGERLARERPDVVVAALSTTAGSGYLVDAVALPTFVQELIAEVEHRGRPEGSLGPSARVITSLATPALGRLAKSVASGTIEPLANASTTDASVVDDRLVVKVTRRLIEGPSPGVELLSFLSDRARFDASPRFAGCLELRSGTGGETATTLVALEEYLVHESGGLDYVVDALVHSLEETLAHGMTHDIEMLEPVRMVDVVTSTYPADHALLGPHQEWALQIGHLVGSLHLALASDREDPDLRPESLGLSERQAMYHRTRRMARAALVDVDEDDPKSLQALAGMEAELFDHLRRLPSTPMAVEKIRVHGDCQLTNLPWRGRDFGIVGFEGEPGRSPVQRRAKQPGAVDLAGMVRSFDNAARLGSERIERDLTAAIPDGMVDKWVSTWFRWVSGTFLRGYLETTSGAPFVPAELEHLGVLVEFHLLEQAIFELQRDRIARPDQLDIIATRILQILRRPA
jgi:maltose alpha-D-glucosyltransferase/alpha-amylase